MSPFDKIKADAKLAWEAIDSRLAAIPSPGLRLAIIAAALVIILLVIIRVLPELIFIAVAGFVVWAAMRALTSLDDGD